MTIVFILILLLGTGIGLVIFFVVRSVLVPKRIESIAALVKQGKPQSAAKAAKVLIAKEPRNPEAHYLLGLAYVADNKAELALMEFKTVNQIGVFGPFIPEIEFRRKQGQLFVRFGQVEEALKEYLLLIKLEPYQADNYYWAGKLFQERSRSDMATTYLKKAVELDPRNGSAHFELGMLLYREKRAVEAMAEIESALKYEPDNAKGYFYLGKLLKDNHDYVGALLAFEKAQRDQELKAKALVERGGCYMSTNAIDKAIVEFERAVKVAGDEGSSESLYGRYFLAMCYEKQRRLELAIEQWEKIYAKKPTFKDVADKLSHYQEFRTDDKMKDYLTSSKDEFVEICKAVAVQAMSLQVRDVTDIQNGCDLIAVEGDQAKWRNVRKQPKLLRFLRIPDMIDDSTIRSLQEEMKKLGILRAMVVTSSAFSRAAIDFADSRPIDLINKDQLQELLDKTNIYGSDQRA